MPSYENLVVGLSLFACGFGSGAALRLYCQSLHRKYRVLFIFVCFHVIRSLTLLGINMWWKVRPHNAYAWVWVCTEPLLWLFYVLLVLELYSLILQKYKGLQTVGRWVFLVAMSLSILISTLSVLPTLNNPSEKVTVIFYFTLIDRGIMFSLVLFILLILWLLSWYPISLTRNLVIHTGVCTIFLITNGLGYLVRNVQGTVANHAVNVAIVLLTIVCWTAWMLLLTRKGEATKMVVRHEFSADEEKRLLDQLTAINSSLLRATRK